MTDAEQLAAYRAMQRFVQEQYDTAEQKLAALKAQHKEKTATYRQLWADKMTYKTILALYKKHGLC